MPGASAGRAKAEIPPAPPPPVRAISTSTSVEPAPEMKALPPLMTYSLPCSSARVLSEPASAGQVRTPLLAHRGAAPGAEHPRRHVVDGDEGRGRRIDRGHLLEHQRRVETRQRQPLDAFRRIEPA